MKKKSVLSLFLFILLILAGCNNPKNHSKSSKYIITKENGRIIKAYLAFEDYLNSDRSWENYKKTVLDAFPEMQAVHSKQISWGSIDSLKFPEEVKNYKKEDWEKYFNQYNDKTLGFLFDSLIQKANTILRPLNDYPVDLCLFIPYGGCFILSGPERSTIYISLLIDPADVQKIIVHEYAHNPWFNKGSKNGVDKHR